jgi:hypothetical protein
VAGATTTTSADRPRRVWGMGSASSHSDDCAFSDATADSVTDPTKRAAPAVITGVTCAPASTSRRHSSTAL